MIPLLFISNQFYSGKSSMCVGIGKLLIEKGFRVGYMKPVVTIPVRISNITTDEDAFYISRIFGMKENLKDIAPIISPLQNYLKNSKIKDFSSKSVSSIKSSYEKLKKDKDFMLVEGARNIEEGLSLKISSREISRVISAKTIVIMKYSDEITDQILFYSEFFAQNFGGVIINLIPVDNLVYLEDSVLPFLKEKGIKVFGCVTSDKVLSSVSVKEIAKFLDGKVLSAENKIDELVESFMLGAMGQEQALKFFRMKANKAVITGGDRADVQLAALETQTKCLILTGNFQPSSIILGRAEELGVPVILVKDDTLTAVEKLNEIIGHTGFHAFKKIDKILDITKNFIDIDSLMNITKN